MGELSLLVSMALLDFAPPSSLSSTRIAVQSSSSSAALALPTLLAPAVAVSPVCKEGEFYLLLRFGILASTLWAPALSNLAVVIAEKPSSNKEKTKPVVVVSKTEKKMVEGEVKKAAVKTNDGKVKVGKATALAQGVAAVVAAAETRPPKPTAEEESLVSSSTPSPQLKQIVASPSEGCCCTVS